MSDPLFEKVYSLLHFDGANGSTTITDSVAGRSWTASNQAALSTVNPKIGTAALDLDGTGDYVSEGVAADYRWMHNGTQDYTLEGWYYRDAASDDTFLDTGGASSANYGTFGRFTSSNEVLFILAKGTGGNYAAQAQTAIGVVPVGEWFHMAICVTANCRTEIYINGTRVLNYQHAYPCVDGANALNLRYGAYTAGGGFDFAGQMDEVRLTQAIRYSKDFTPPTIAFPDAGAPYVPDGTPEWTPAELTTQLWLDAADAATITEAAGAVSQWDDKSPNAYTFSAASNQPDISTETLNSLPVVQFSGTEYLTSDQTAADFEWMRGATPYYMAIVARLGSSSNPNSYMLLMSSGGGSRTVAGFDIAYDDRAGIFSEAIRSLVSSGTTDAGVPIDVAAEGLIPPNKPTSIGVTIDPAAATQERSDWRKNGNSVFGGTNGKSGNLAGTTANPLRIGALGNSGSFALDGMIAEIVALPYVPNGLEREQIEGYLAWKWGLEDDLPGDHAFIDAPPLQNLWEPSDITTELWLDAADPTTITEVANVVSQWDDKSGNARHAANIDTNRQPTYDPANDWIDFDGTADRLSLASQPFSGATERLVIAVIQQDVAGSTGNGYFTASDVGAGLGSYWDLCPEGSNFYIRLSGNDAFQPNITLNTQEIVSADWLGVQGSGNAGVYINGTNSPRVSGSSQTINTSVGTAWIGATPNQGGIHFNGKICEMVVLTGAETTTENRELLEGYLAWKWGQEAKLPLDHPYKYAPPTAAAADDPYFNDVWLLSPYEVDLDSVTNGITFSAFNGAAVGPGGKWDNGLILDGVNDYAVIDSPIADTRFLHDGTTTYTLDLWVNFDTTIANDTILTSNEIDANKVGIYLYGQSGGTVKYLIGASGSSAGSVTTAALSPDTWNFIRVLFDHTTGDLSIYANGVLGATITASGFNLGDSETQLRIGRWANSAQYLFGGELDDFRITKNVLRSGTEVPTGPFPTTAGPVVGPVVTGPANQSVNEFTDATFVVSATGDSPFTYQWYQVGVGALVGETTDTLVVANVQYPADDQNQYYCDVTDVNTLTTTSATATLTVVDVLGPEFTTQPQDVFPLDGEQKSFFVVATGVPTLTYQWYEVTAGLLTGEINDTLTITFAAADAGKEYYCVVTDGNTATAQSDNALVTIVTNPTFTQEPVATGVIEYRDASFGATAIGNGPFVYDWYNDIDGLVGAAAGSIYTFPAALTDDGKEYYTIVTDIYDHSAQSTQAPLSVIPSQHANTPPFIDADIVGPENALVPFGQAATFTVEILDSIAVAPFTIDWYNDVDGLVQADGGLEYTFDPVQADNGKNYFVVVTDSLGQFGQSQYGQLILRPADLVLSWSMADGTVDNTVTKYQSVAWSVYDAASDAEDGAFTCPVRAHRGLDDEGRTYWIPFYDKSARASRGPLVNDAYNRYYWTQDGQDARYAPLENLKLDTLTTGITLGVPAPIKQPQLFASTPDDSADLESRSYVYTYVSVYGEEGPPSSPITATGDADGAWILSNMEIGPNDDKKRRLTVKRIYRTVTAANGDTDFYLVTSLPITVRRYTDTKKVSEVSLNNTLESTNWSPPPEGLSGLIAHPNGFFIGFVGRDIYMSEPYRPHAWNPAYVVSTLSDVVGFGIFGSTVVVCTESYPYTLTGINPAAMAFDQHDTPEPCVSRYGIVSMPFGVYYPGPNGLMLASPHGFQNATKELMTKEEWQNRYNVTEIDAAQYQSQYVAFYSPTKGVMFAPDEQMAALVDLDLTGSAAEPDQMETIFTDEYSGRTYLIEDCNMYEWNPVSGAPLEFDWTSMEFDAADPVNFGAARIIWYSRYTPPTEEETQEFRDYNSARMSTKPLNPFNFHVINGVEDTDPAGYENWPEIKQPFSWSPLIKVPFPGEPWPNTPFVIMELIANEKVVFTKEIANTSIFRLPSGWKATRFKIRLRSNVPIQSVKMAETGKELSRV